MDPASLYTALQVDHCTAKLWSGMLLEDHKACDVQPRMIITGIHSLCL